MKITLLSDDTVMGGMSVATIGFFDGVHRGHQFLLRQVVEAARKSGMESMAITFDNHPRVVLGSDYRPTLLTSLDEKLRLIADTGVDRCVVLPFTKEMASLEAYDFMRDILKSRLNVGKLLIGYDNRFGHNRSEGFDDYARYGRELGIEVLLNTALVTDGMKFSSSLVRRLLAEGNVEKAAECLGRPYSISGVVVDGYKEGRKLGFPTANIDIDDKCRLIPAVGVYAVKVKGTDNDDAMTGMLNIGYRPTFGGEKLSVEVNIFGFDGNLYDKQLEVEFCRRIRGERKFETIEQLTEQLKKDKLEILKL